MSNNNNSGDLKSLSDLQKSVTQNAETEPPFSGDLLDEKRDGMYHCVVCDQPLFSSETKFESGSGWPSFFQALKDESIELQPDHSAGMERTEVLCGKCGAHLGHVFDDGPEPTGKRYCINSCALGFSSEE